MGGALRAPLRLQPQACPVGSLRQRQRRPRCAPTGTEDEECGRREPGRNKRLRKSGKDYTWNAGSKEASEAMRPFVLPNPPTVPKESSKPLEAWSTIALWCGVCPKARPKGTG